MVRFRWKDSWKNVFHLVTCSNIIQALKTVIHRILVQQYCTTPYGVSQSKELIAMNTVSGVTLSNTSIAVYTSLWKAKDNKIKAELNSCSKVNSDSPYKMIMSSSKTGLCHLPNCHVVNRHGLISLKVGASLWNWSDS